MGANEGVDVGRMEGVMLGTTDGERLGLNDGKILGIGVGIKEIVGNSVGLTGTVETVDGTKVGGVVG